MIDVGQLERAVRQAPGDAIVVSKGQLSQMFDEMRRGQAARRSLVNLRSIAAVAGTTT